MEPIFPELPATLGVYTLAQLLETREDGDLYTATQSHVERAVVVEVMRPGATREDEARFLESARMRVAADSLPNVAQVYESLKADGLWFLTQELPQGRSLAETAAAGERLSVRATCRIIETAARIYDLCARAGLATREPSAASVYIDEADTPRFLSPVTASRGSAATPDAEDMAALANALQSVRPKDVPGANRTLTLLHWMREGYEGQLLDWSTIGASAHTVLEQMGGNAEAETDDTPSDASLKRQRRKLRRKLLHRAGHALLLGGIAGICALTGLLFPVDRMEELPAMQDDGIYVRTAGERGLTAVGLAPVSNGEYNSFLAAWNAMPAAARAELCKGFYHLVDDPAPQGRDEQASDDDSPVTGISYHAALAYARYMKADLPTAAQLQAVLPLVPFPGKEWVRSEKGDLPADLAPVGSVMRMNTGEPYAPQIMTDARHRDNETTFRIAVKKPRSL